MIANSEISNLIQEISSRSFDSSLKNK
jgi:hypothetical protein